METFYVVTNTLGTICEEHKTTFFLLPLHPGIKLGYLVNGC